mmetsp:Transcript_4522/g.15016  ORF Transcript_4522/g.15016 Transcript_4522/m.15016 type:complete len:403 (+) Transcript_4522:411-1619(+)
MARFVGTCSVCLSECEASETVSLRCGHEFCVACLKGMAQHEHTRCPTCRQPHQLDPSELKQAFEKYRSDYRSWRSGGAKGCAGEVEKVSSPPKTKTTTTAETTPDEGKKIAEQCKDVAAFRDYSVPHERQDVVTRHYRLMRQHQTVDFVARMAEKYSFRDGRYRALMTIREAFDTLEDYVDSSDPDLGLPNVIHGLQTAEAIRKAGHPDWFVLTGLIHDLGKIMFLWGAEADGQKGTADGDQWALGGDTFVVGCELPQGPARPGIVFPEFSALNPDMKDPRYNTTLGVYERNCGLDTLKFAYGHDEYLYQMLKANQDNPAAKEKLPDHALAMVRYHSAYPWHTARVYDHFMQPQDFDTLNWVLAFNNFDLYTKDEANALSLDDLWPYYQTLIDKYLPGQLKW